MRMTMTRRMNNPEGHNTGSGKVRWLYQRRLALIVTLAIGIGASVAVLFVAQRWESETVRIDYEVASNDRMLAVKRTVQDHVAVLDMLGRFCEVTKRVDRGEFQQFIRPALDRDSDLMMMAWLPRVPRGQREAFEMAAQSSGLAGFRIAGRDAQGKPTETGNAADFFPVLCAEPMDRNGAMLGMDFGSNPILRDALRLAGDKKQTVVVINTPGLFSPVETTEAPSARNGAPRLLCLVLQPVYQVGDHRGKTETGRENLAGFTACVFDIGEGMENTMRQVKSSGLDISIYDETGSNRQCLYNYRSPLHMLADTAPPDAKWAQLIKQHGSMSFPLADRTWTVVCNPTRAFLFSHTPEDSLMLMACGLMATIMLVGHLLWIIRHTVQTEQLVAGRTSELAAEVAQHKRTAAALQESENRYRTLFENSADALLIFDGRKIADCNTTALKMFHAKDKSAFIGMHPAQISPPRQPSGMYSQKWADQKIAEAFDKGAIRFDCVCRRRDGEDFLAEVSLTAIEVGGQKVLLAAINDVTETRQAQEQLQLRDSALKATVNGMLITDNRGQIVWVNPSFTKLTGYAYGEAVGQSLRLVMSSSQDIKSYEDMLATVLSGKSWRGEISSQRKDGIVRIEEMTVTPVRNSEDSVTHFIAVIQDVTIRKQAEEELLRAKEAAEAATRAKSEFLASMSHEIRTPMNGVIGMTGLLLDTELTPEQREYAKIVRNCGNTLLTIINDVLDFSKIESGKMTIEPTGFNLRQATEEVTDMLLADADDKGIELIVRYMPNTPNRVVGDPGRIRQVLTNLIGNAIKFTDSGHVLVTVECEAVVDKKASLRFSVQDTGIGIPTDKISDLFQRFSQVDASATRRHGGTGLGLAISRQLVELMGGRINVQSQLGAGSTFWFTLQLPLDSKPDTVIPPSHVLKNMRVLVVDDNEVNRRIVEEQLGSCEARISQASSAEEGLRVMREAVAAGDPIQVAVVDHQMPNTDGLTFGGTVKADAALRTTVLVMLSSMGQRHLTPELREAGFAACLSKAVYASQLIRTIAEAWTSHAVGGQAAVEPKPSLPVIRARVLVAEDNVANQKVAVRLLEKLGCRVDVAATGAEAVLLLRLLSYDLVFMDCQMPEMNGYEATREIRRQKGLNRKVPIVAMTANAMSGDREECLAAGMDDYIAKPIELEQIVEMLQRWVRSAGESDRGKPAPSRVETAPAVPPTPPSTPAAVNAEALDRLRELSDGDALSFLKDLLGTYQNDTTQRLTVLRAACAAADAGGLRRAAHAIKGSSLNVGALHLADLCQQVELLAESGALDAIAGLVTQIGQEFERVKAALDDYTKA
jgi:two-component system, sensor histidine kinase and response regulator